MNISRILCGITIFLVLQTGLIGVTYTWVKVHQQRQVLIKNVSITNIRCSDIYCYDINGYGLLSDNNSCSFHLLAKQKTPFAINNTIAIGLCYTENETNNQMLSFTAIIFGIIMWGMFYRFTRDIEPNASARICTCTVSDSVILTHQNSFDVYPEVNQPSISHRNAINCDRCMK